MKWKDTVYVNNGTEKSCGVAILIKNDILENIKELYSDKTGRIIIIEFKYKNIVYRLINVHYCSKVWGHLEISLFLKEKHCFFKQCFKLI